MDPDTLIFSTNIALNGSENLATLTFSPVTNYIIVGTDSSNIELFDQDGVYIETFDAIEAQIVYATPLNTSNQFITSKNVGKNLQIVDILGKTISQDYSSDTNLVGKFYAAAIHESDSFFCVAGENKEFFLFTGAPPPVSVSCIFTKQITFSDSCVDCLDEVDYTTNTECSNDINVKFYKWSASIDTSKEQTPKVFNGILTISGYDLTTLTPLTQSFFNNNVALSF